ncbi:MULTISPECIES: hypothetical protein [unclassified Spirosoma]|uniref:hypothetical protein n=1 Tax=unclassified Spirosoma TaxID=2621999 RepID=UPI00095F3033|nr:MULTISPECIES: hypothetical protein [unclassified Spirosoma]MBN8826306.1 hypothetical protein [Spirosoma sp.]OJW75204.1 MAG: hypothetical protein BGO59_18095 [Spirosoma sp. 48-14]
MKLTHHILLFLLSGCLFQVRAQCLTCPKKDQPTQPQSITLSSGGVIITSLPTAITAGTKLSVVMIDNTLNNPTPFQKKLQKPTTNKAPDCLKTSIQSAIDATNSNRSSYETEITHYKEKTYQITGSETQTLTNAEHALGPVIYNTPGEGSFQVMKRYADRQFLRKRFESTEYVGWNQYKPLVDSLYPSYNRFATIVNQLTLTLDAMDRKGVSCCKTSEAKVYDSLKERQCQYLDSLQNTQVQLCFVANTVFETNKAWIENWLWYTDGKPLLNPFGVVSPANLNAKIERDLAAAEEVLRLYRMVSDQCCQSTQAAELVKTLKTDIVQLTKALVDLRKAKEAAPTRQSKFENWLKSTAQTEDVLNEVVLFASSCPQINWMTHYNAKKNYAPLEPGGLQPDLVHENDIMRGLVHNLPKDTEVSAKEVVKEAKIRTEIDVQTDAFAETFQQALISSSAIATLLNRIRGVLNTVQTIATPQEAKTQTTAALTAAGRPKRQKQQVDQPRQAVIILELRDIVFVRLPKAPVRQKLTGKALAERKLAILKRIQNQYDTLKAQLNSALKRDNSAQDVKSVSALEFDEAVETLIDEVQQELASLSADVTTLSTCADRLTTFRLSKQLIDWLIEQTDPPVDDLKLAYGAFDKSKANPEPLLRSEDLLVNESREAKGTKAISYTISEAGKDKPVAKGSYNTYNTVRFWPSISINYVVGSRAVSIFDNATGQFQTNTDVDNFEAVAGVKWYLGPSNMTRTHKRSKFIRDTFGSRYSMQRGNSILGKTFLTLGLGVSHKFLRNYFLGLGIDIVPGLSLQGGGNVFFRKAYDLNNGQIMKEYDVPATCAFFGIAIDPNIVTKLLSIF